MTIEAERSGFVYIVGAGPGDPRLLTLKAKNCLERADVVVYDRLVSPSILAYARPEAELIYAGKDPNGEGVSQEWVNKILVSKALEGKFVVRLKNGDPFVFGRGAEEVEALINAGIPFEIVPGVSSAFAVPAYAGIPLTDRRFSSSFVVTVGRNSPLSEKGQRANLRQLAIADTVIVLMGVGELENVVKKLLEGGKSLQTPAAIVEWGTTSSQKTIVATLGEIASAAKAKGIQPPSVLIVGDVVKLREKLDWYERKPLFGTRVLLTCINERDRKFAEGIEDLGAEVIRLPFSGLKRKSYFQANLNFNKNLLLSCNCLVFGCPHAVDAFFELAISEGIDLRAFARIRFAAFGKRTSQALSKLCIFPDAVLEEIAWPELNAKVLAYGKNGQMLETMHFLVWHGCKVLTDLVNQLKKLGAKVDEIEIAGIEPVPNKFFKALLKKPIDIFVFTHPCAVYKLAGALKSGELRLERGILFAVGEDTVFALRQFGFSPNIGAETEDFEVSFEPNILSVFASL